MPSDLDNFTRGYLEAALWSSNDPDTEDPLDATYDIESFDAESKATAQRVCERFIDENSAALAFYCEQIVTVDDDYPMAYAGHDLWLTRVGHGAGFWDRDLKDIGETLSDAARKLGEANVCPVDDETITIEDHTAPLDPVAGVRELDKDIAILQAEDRFTRHRATRAPFNR